MQFRLATNVFQLYVSVIMDDLTKRCPYCDEEIRANAVKCKHCGSFLSDSSSAAALRQTSVKQALMARYEVLEELGRGGMGVVYKAIQRNLNRPVALKVLPQQITPDEEFLKRFHSEARKAAQINHPNIITIYDEGVENGVHFIAMEYIDGDDLRNLILKNGPLPINKTILWLKPVIEALGYAHQKGLIHRDIKSANILISKTGRPVLTDFGIARLAESSQLTRAAGDSTQLTRAGMILGTLQYMSPEQITGMSATPLSDLYAMGVVLYHCLTGELPFRGDTDWSTMQKIANLPPTAPRGIRTDIPKTIETLVLKCMAKNSAQRYQSCEELAAALEKAGAEAVSPRKKVNETDGATIIAQPVKRTANEPQRAREKSAPAKSRTLALGIAGLAVLAILISVFLWRNHRAKQTEINALLAQAEALYHEGNLIAPPENNAFELCRQVLARDAEHEAAHKLRELIRDILLGKVAALRQKGEMVQARLEAEKFADLFPQDARVRNYVTLFDLEKRAQEAAAFRNYIAPEYDNVLELSRSIQGLESENKLAHDLLREAKSWLMREHRRAVSAKNAERAIALAQKGREFFPEEHAFREEQTPPQIEDNSSAPSRLNASAVGGSLLKAFNDHLASDNFELARMELLKAQRSRGQNVFEKEKALLFESWGDHFMKQGRYDSALVKFKNAFVARPGNDALKTKLRDALWLDLELVAVPGGLFEMGDTFGQGESDERPKHQVQLRGFRMSKYEITFAQFDAFCEATKRTKPHDNGWGRGRLPVINVGHYDAVAFCQWLSQRTAKEVRLPTEAEWEYGARAGQNAQWAGTNDIAKLNDYAWSLANSGERTRVVGQKRANNFGLFDMSGNAFEWCRDRYDETYYQRSSAANPTGAAQGNRFVLRGGSALNTSVDLRCANRAANKPEEWSFPTGFRVVSVN